MAEVRLQRRQCAVAGIEPQNGAALVASAAFEALRDLLRMHR